MLFHTWPFLLFFVAFLALYLPLRATRLRVPILLVASYVFYGWWEPYYLALIVYSTLIDYFAVKLMASGRARKPWLVVSIANNLALLGFFKYRTFVVDNVNALLDGLGSGMLIDDPTPGLLLPVGISFYTFQSMSYTIDYYRREIQAEHSFLRFASFVALFPQLVAGPIERARNLLPQLQRAPVIRWHDVQDGLSLFVVGLFKKVALANYLALYVDKVYAVPERHSSRALLIATFFFAWQIYFDFSGYSDMARGVGRIMGLRLMVNFRNPYTATDLGAFWRRWHISLSTWFRDYVYIPLGGNRHGTVRMCINILLTMVISGFWHGAAWTFVIWGALHGVARVATLPLEKSRAWKYRTPKLLKQAVVFLFVMLTWVFFRAETLGDAWTILGRICRPSFDDPLYPALAMGLVLSVWAYQLAYESVFRPLLALRIVRVALVVFMILWLAIVPASDAQPFIYFQF